MLHLQSLPKYRLNKHTIPIIVKLGTYNLPTQQNLEQSYLSMTSASVTIWIFTGLN